MNITGVLLDNVFYIISNQVMWRRYPCCCDFCMDLKWEECESKDLVGDLETLVEAAASIYITHGTGYFCNSIKFLNLVIIIHRSLHW